MCSSDLTFTVTYTATATEQEWLVAFTEDVSCGQNVEMFMLTSSGQSPKTETFTYTAPQSGSCTFSNGQYEFTGGTSISIPQASVTVQTSCTDTSWTPAPNTVCSGTSFTQTSNCGSTHTTTGTKDCSVSCTDTSWTPSTSTVCEGDAFTQTSNCGNPRSATGTQQCTVLSSTGSLVRNAPTTVGPGKPITLTYTADAPRDALSNPVTDWFVAYSEQVSCGNNIENFILSNSAQPSKTETHTFTAPQTGTCVLSGGYYEFTNANQQAIPAHTITITTPEQTCSVLDGNTCTALEVCNGGSMVTATEDRKSTRLNSSHMPLSRMPSSA